MHSETPRETEWMLVSDLDGTLLGEPEATVRFQQWWSSRPRDGRLVYASGRRYESVLESIREFQLPSPDAIVADVGTDIRLFGQGTSLVEWSSRWWSSWETDCVRRILDRQPELEPQPKHCQSDYKCSYFVRDAAPGWLTRTQCQLREQRIAVELIFSSNRDLDVLPAGVHKGAAAEFLAQKWRIPRARVFVAGDSGNDLSMFVQGFRGIVVGNAQLEMGQLSGPNVYRSLDTYADGVIDGLRHWLHHVFLKTAEGRVSAFED